MEWNETPLERNPFCSDKRSRFDISRVLMVVNYDCGHRPGNSACKPCSLDLHARMILSQSSDTHTHTHTRTNLHKMLGVARYPFINIHCCSSPYKCWPHCGDATFIRGLSANKCATAATEGLRRRLDREGGRG